jgi:hypothetical protein
MRKILLIFLLFVFLFRSNLASTQVQNSGETSVQVEISRDLQSESINDENIGYSRKIDEIFRNPVIANGIDTGTEALNRSLESIMDSVFYSVMDNDRRFVFTKQSWFQIGLRRNVISAANGRYIVVDRFYSGPGYKRRIFETSNLGWVLGTEVTGEILQIYLLTDGKRVFDQQNASTIRNQSSNWFGFLPFLSSILPPSFNQNELYDPITEIETPVTFPLNSRIFDEMPIGSIRSYNLTGGIRLSVDIAELIPSEKINHLRKIADLSPLFPVSLFRRGEHRISVFRRQKDKAWVGVNNIDRSGLLFEGSIGALYAVFKGAMGFSFGNFSWIWGGIPIAFTPLNFNYQKSLAQLFDQVFEYDMTHPRGIQCYESAVRGDFTESFTAAFDTKNGLQNGVTFQYARNQDRKERTNRRGPNLAVYKDIREISSAKSEIEIKDLHGKYYILEALNELNDKNWNILVGEQETFFRAVVEMAVKPLVKYERNGNYTYENAKEPYKFSMTFLIEDRYTNTKEFNNYLDRIRGVSGMELNDINKFPIRSFEKMRLRSHELNYASPEETLKKLHISPTALGRFSAQVNVSIPSVGFNKLLMKKSSEVLQAITDVFGVKSITLTGSGFKTLLFDLLAEPFDMLNLRVRRFSHFIFAERILESINIIRSNSRPERQLEGFLKLINNAYPEEFMSVILRLVPKELSSRSVRITTKPIPQASQSDKSIFKKINGYEKTEGLRFPQQSRYGKIKNKIAQFYLDKPEAEKSKVDITRIQLFTKQSPISSEESWLPLEINAIDRVGVFASIEVDPQDHKSDFKLYARLEEAGRLQLGKFDLGEIVIDSKEMIRSLNEAGKIIYSIEVIGSRSPFFKIMLLEFAQRPTQFRLSLALSKDGDLWSPERNVEFTFEQGMLRSLKE